MCRLQRRHVDELLPARRGPVLGLVCLDWAGGYRRINADVEKGYALIPLRVYFKQGRAKMLLALARGKRTSSIRRDSC